MALFGSVEGKELVKLVELTLQDDMLLGGNKGAELGGTGNDL